MRFFCFLKENSEKGRRREGRLREMWRGVIYIHGGGGGGQLGRNEFSVPTGYYVGI